MLKKLSLGLLTTLLLSLFGCVSARTKVAQVPASPEVLLSESRYRKEYLFVPGDQLEVAVRRVPEVSRTVTVRPDGFITLPLVNDVKASGTTPTELRETLTKLFSSRLVNPEITVIATQVPPPVVYVVGEVTNNAVVPLRNAPDALAAIAYAGGFRRSAKAKLTTIIRLGDDGYIRGIPLSDPAGAQPGPVMGMRNVQLQADDIIFVPESGRSQVSRFLDDFVNRPLQSVGGALGLYVNVKWIQTLP
jgi:polysaccharide export outer membrane protein